MNSLAVLGSLGVIFVTFTFIFLCIFMAMNWFSNCILMESQGQPCWKLIIPFYGSYIRHKTLSYTIIFWLTILLFIVYTVLGVIFLKNKDMNNIITSIYSLLIWILTITYGIGICKKFNKGIGFTIGYVIFTPIFNLILAGEQIGNGVWSRMTGGRKAFCIIFTILTLCSIGLLGFALVGFLAQF